jgi:hypothetical protein
LRLVLLLFPITQSDLTDIASATSFAPLPKFHTI